MKSITYYVILLVLKLKGVKQDFSKSPIDYKKLRKEDVHTPDAKILKPHQLRHFKVLDTAITEITPANPTGNLIIFCHGGAFVYGPAQHHWETAKQLVSGTACTLWLVDYPKAPENKIDTISTNLDAVYVKALEAYPVRKILLLGDSVGGTLVTSLTQRLIQQAITLPAQLILISPVMDASVSNPEITGLENRDPMLSKAGVLSAKKMAAVDGDLDDVQISPIRGDFSHFPPTVMFLAEDDITYPDQKIAAQKMTDANVALTVFIGKGMPHIWPFLPMMKEAKKALGEIITRIKETTLN